jgi:hypothetical protein
MPWRDFVALRARLVLRLGVLRLLVPAAGRVREFRARRFFVPMMAESSPRAGQMPRGERLAQR